MILKHNDQQTDFQAHLIIFVFSFMLMIKFISFLNSPLPVKHYKNYENSYFITTDKSYIFVSFTVLSYIFFKL